MLVGALIGNALWFRARLPHAGAAFAIACPAHDLPKSIKAFKTFGFCFGC